MSTAYDTGDMERRIVSSIEKTANMYKEASSQEEMDEALVKVFKEEGVNPEFAYAAACAANKAMSVSYLKEHGDDTRAESFLLFNPEHVKELMGAKDESSCEGKCEDMPEDAEVIIEVHKEASMEKAASAEVKEPVELDYTLGELLKKTAKALSKVDRALEGCYQDLLQKEANYHRTITELHHTALNEEEKGAAVSTFGKSASKVLEDAEHSAPSYVPNHCIAPDTYGVSLIKKASEAYAQHQDCMDALQYAITKEAQLHDTYNRLKEHYGYMRKQASKWDTTPLRKVAGREEAILVADAIGGIPAGLAAGAADSIFGSAQDVYDTMKGYRDWKSGITDARKDQVLDAELLKSDRQLDRMLAWSDMMSDPRLKGYPAEDVHMAVNKLMDMDSQLESPANREILRQNLRRAMVQSGELSTADTAALKSTLSHTTGAPRYDEDISGAVSAKGYGSRGLNGKGLGESLSNFLKTVGELPSKGIKVIGESIDRKEKIEKEKADAEAAKIKAQKMEQQAEEDRVLRNEQMKALNEARVKELQGRTAVSESAAATEKSKKLSEDARREILSERLKSGKLTDAMVNEILESLKNSGDYDSFAKVLAGMKGRYNSGKESKGKATL